ncbi:GNAT family N-acetyltransferase [Legionella resiliens]|uniref:GNAT family N-acetyltransferase n=1 Tax=Legionella resiliens TaxID=2905958 RepID=A0ABS8X434_9GAMM|nr:MULTISPECIES: GNAT family N-acetyltransferase [unclassified Legionella]MCE0722939.1 GNAT family N-acetyltransferase [Legionella sp. 9fVS26]MCE3532092.1 GNAT family N-acetyltransferase [Legionella sp. 8cVS16]
MQKLIHDFHEMERCFFSLISLNCLDYQTITAFETGVLATGLNPAFAIKTDTDKEFLHDLAKCRSYFAQKNLPWAIIVAEDTPIFSEHDNQLRQDYELTDTGVGMAFNLMANSLNIPDNPLEFREMNEDLPTWSIPLIHGFQSTPEITHVYTLRHDEALKKSNDMYHFSGFFAGEAVVSVTLTVKDNLARIDDLATIPSFQKRGCASAMMVYALKKALDLKVQTCFLEASAAGLNLYTRIGFQSLFTNHYYELSTM